MLAIVLLSLVASCHKEEIPTSLSGYFYTPDTKAIEQPLYLFIDGTNKGKLPYIKTTANVPLGFSNPELSSKALQFTFMSGKHIFEARRSDGSVMASATITFAFYKNKTESDIYSNVGGAGNVLAGNKVEAWLME